MTVRSTAPRFREALKAGICTLYFVPAGMTGTVEGLDVDHEAGHPVALVHWDWTVMDDGLWCGVLTGDEVVADRVAVGELVWKGDE